MLTQGDVATALPANLKSAATLELTDLINTISSDPIEADHIRENFVGYTTVLKDGRFKAEDYVRAVAYVSFKLMGHSNKDAYIRTFPDRYQRLMSMGTSEKDLSAYVSAYHKGKLVNLIMEQSLVPTWVVNQDLSQKAINHLANLMITASSEKVQADAAIGLLAHLKKPEVKGLAVNIDMKDNSGLNELKDTLAKLAKTQLAMIESGTPTSDIAAARLIEGEYKEA